MSAKYKSPSFLLPNEINTNTNPVNTDGNPATGTGINSLYSMDFDGSSYINAGNDSSLAISGDFTISLWVNQTTTTAFSYLLDKGGAGSSINYRGGINSSNQVYFQISGNSLTSTGTITNGTWSHIVLVKSGTSMNIYIDNTAETPATAPATAYTGTENLEIGRQTGGANYLDGKIDEVAIFNRALNTTEIAALYDGTGSNIRPSNLMASNLGPIAYYPLGEQAQNSGYPSATGNEWQFPNGVLQDYVMDFDGSTDYINANATVQSDLDFSVSAWINPASYNKAILGTRPTVSAGTSNGFTININSSGNLWGRIFTESTVTQVQTGSTIPLNNWSHIAITYDSSSKTLKTYLNGSEVGSVVGSVSSIASTNKLNIGRASVGSSGYSYFNGSISNTQIFNSVIPENGTNSIETLYNNGSPLTSMSGFTSLTNWWKLNADSVYTPSAPNYTTALDFDGNNDLVNANSVISSISSSTTGTVSCWIKYTTGGSTVYMITFTSNTNTSQQYLTFQGNSNGVAYAQLKNKWILQTNSAVFTSGNWYHYAVTQNGTEPKIYINGTEYSSGNGAALTTYGGTDGTEWWPNLSDFNTVTIGGMIWNSGGTVYTNYGDQDLSNISIFNSALTATQISTLFNFGTPQSAISFSPQAWWKLDDQTTITDSSGNGNTGTNNGATNVSSGVAFTPSWKIPSALTIPTVNYTSALSFDGGNRYINCGTGFGNALGNYSGDLTISLWLNRFSNSSQKGIFYFGGFGNSRGTLEVYGGGTGVSVLAGGTMSSGGLDELNTWYHLCIVYKAGDINNSKIYINGQSQTTNTTGSYASSKNFSGDSTIIGGYYGPLYTFNGLISNAALFTSELSSSQVLSIYNDGQPESSISFSPTSWWKLNNLSSGLLDSGSSNNDGTNSGSSQTVKVDSNVYVGNVPVNGVSTTLPSTALQQSDLQFDSPYSNYSLSFDGATDYLDVVNSSAVPAIFQNIGNSNSYSISSWIKTTVNDSETYYWFTNDTIIELRTEDSSGTHVPFNLSLLSGKLFFARTPDRTASDQAFQSSTSVNTGSWVHCVATVNVNTLKLYINGSLDTTHTFTDATGDCSVGSNTSNLLIGSRSTDTGGNEGYFTGQIDETAIFNTELTSAQVLEIYNNGKPSNLSNYSGTAPISWWRLGENAYFVNNAITVPNSISGAPNGVGPGTVVDMLSADAPGTYANGVGDGLAITDRVGDAPLSTANSQSYNMIPDDKVPYVPGYVGNQIANTYSMAFDGNNQYIDLGNSTQVQPVKEMSISAWINASSLATYSGIVSATYNGSSYDGFSLRLAASVSNKVEFYVKTNVYGIPISTTTINTNEWYHLAGTYDGVNAKLYVNGTLEDTVSLTGNISYTDGSRNTIIGSLYPNVFEFTGKIDEVAIFDKALTADQIKFDLYNATTTGKTADIANNPNLPTPVAWYRMGD